MNEKFVISLTEIAETQAIDIFSENLKNLLLQPPLKGKIVLGVDPAFRTGCKLAVVDETGKVLVSMSCIQRTTGMILQVRKVMPAIV